MPPLNKRKSHIKEDKELEEIINEELDKEYDNLTDEEIEQDKEFKEFENMSKKECAIHLNTEDIIELFRDNKKILGILNGIDKQYITADLMAALFNYGVNQNEAIKTIGKLSDSIDKQSKTIGKFWKYLLVATLGSGIFFYTTAVYQHENIKPIMLDIAKELAKKFD